jgi:hypothetical protein
MLPVYYELRKLDLNSTFICAKQDIIDTLRQENVELAQIKEINRYKLSSKGLNRVQKFTKIHSTLKRLEQEYYGTKNFVFNALNDFYYWENYSEIYNRCEQLFKPKYHLLGYDLSVPCRAININAKKHGIPTGHIQHGLTNYILGTFSLSEQQFLWDELTYDFYKKIQHPAEFYITGSPKIKDPEILKSGDNPVMKFLEEKSKFIILVCFSGSGHNVTEKGHIRNLKILQKIIHEKAEVFWVFKLHPKDSADYYSSFSNATNVLLVDHRHPFYRESIYYFIGAATLTITGGSTVALESLIHQTPVISIDALHELGHVEFLKSDMIYRCDDYDSLKNAIDSITFERADFLVKKELIVRYSEGYFNNKKKNPAKAIARIIKDKIHSESNICVESQAS